jgi:crossover junction endodeoxyribonuclease RusA
MNPITFPWPIYGLNPNHKAHWAVKAKAVKKYKSWCHACLLAAKVKPLHCNRVKISLKFIPPDNRRRDADNCVASCKSLLDAISQAIGIDDSRFDLGAPIIEGTVKHGAVVVTIEPVVDIRLAA